MKKERGIGLKTQLRWCDESLLSFRKRFNAQSNVEALDKIDNILETIKNISKYLNNLNNDLDTVQAGNVSHRIANIKSGVVALKFLVDDSIKKNT